MTKGLLRSLLNIIADLINAVFYRVSELSSDLYLHQTPYQTFGNRFKCASYSWYYRHLQVLLLLVLWQDPSTCIFVYFDVHSIGHWDSKFHYSTDFLLFDNNP